MVPVYERPSSLFNTPFTYCSGCGHGTIHKIVARIIDKLGIRGKTIGVFPVGCASQGAKFFDVDCHLSLHGRAPAVATGIKRSLPDSIVFTYQGDGDFASIGIAEAMHAANRGEKITVIYVNNAIYGMTGGQMAPTTLLGQKTTTSPLARKAGESGYPLKMVEILSSIEGVAYAARTSTHNVKSIRQTEKAVEKAFKNQLELKGFSVVEILSACPTGWKLTPRQCMKWISNEMLKTFPLYEYQAEGREVD